MKKFLILVLGTILCQQAKAQESMPTDSLDLMIGQMIMIGLGDFNQLDTTEQLFESIRSDKVGGVILFEKNLAKEQTQEQLQQILNYSQSQSRIPLFVSIDEEGGRVNRLKTKYGFPKTVTAQYLGELDQLDSTRYYAGQTAAILFSLGINMNFAPDVDVNINPENPVIGKIGRSYSGDYLAVSRHAGEVIEAHDLFGITTVLKHFPGHGSSKNDSHLGMADVSNTWLIEELYPYAMLIDSGKVEAIMTAHIINERIDPNKMPATLSQKVIQDLLRGMMHFSGVVVSDDMQMKAISEEYGLEEAIRMAIVAGVDILLFANNVPDYQLITANQIHSIIRKLVENGDIRRARIVESYERIIGLKKMRGLLSTNLSE